MTSLRAEVVVASNRAASGVYEDTTGPVIVEFLTELGFAVESPVVVRDGAAVHAVSDWFDGLWLAGHDFSRELFTQLSAVWPLSSAG